MVSSVLGFAVGYSYTDRPSGSAPTRLAVQHVSPLTLEVVRTSRLTALMGSVPGHVYLENMALPLPGLLVVTGSKQGSFPGEQAPGDSFTAAFEDFFTSLLPPVLSSR